MPFYSFANLLVASDIPLTGLASVSGPAAADVAIGVGDVPDRLPNAIRVGPNWAVDETRLLIEIPKLARILLTGGRRIQVQPAGHGGADETIPFLTQNVLGLLLQQSGRFVLRASAVEIGGRALLFCGDAGSGKSSIAAAMTRRGYRFLADDICLVEPRSGGGFVVHGDGAQPRIWADAVEALSLSSDKGDAVRDGIAKYHMRLEASSAGALPLAGLYVLGEDPRFETSEIETCGGMKAVQTIRACAYRPLLVQPLGLAGAYLERAAAMARAVGVLLLKRDRGFDWIERGLRTIEESWAC